MNPYDSSTSHCTMLLLLLSRFSRVWLCAIPWTAAHQGPPSLGFSRQEHWSGLPVPSPMHESEKWKWSRSVMSDSSRPHGLQPTWLLPPWDFPGKSTGVGCHCLLRATALYCLLKHCLRASTVTYKLYCSLDSAQHWSATESWSYAAERFFFCFFTRKLGFDI